MQYEDLLSSQDLGVQIHRNLDTRRPIETRLHLHTHWGREAWIQTHLPGYIVILERYIRFTREDVQSEHCYVT